MHVKFGGGRPSLDEAEKISGLGYLICAEALLLVGIPVTARFVLRNRFTRGAIEPARARGLEISLQPVKLPLVFSAAVSYGTHLVFCACAATLFATIPTSLLRDLLNGLVAVLSLVLSGVTSVFVFRRCGGSWRRWYYCALANTCLDWYMSLLAWELYLTGAIEEAEVSSRLKLGIITISLAVPLTAGLVVLQTPLYYWSAYRPMYSAVERLPGKPIGLGCGLNVSTLVAGGLCIIAAFMHSIHEKLHAVTARSVALATAAALADLVLIVTCAVISIVSVHGALHAGSFQWQWRAFLAPSVPLCALFSVRALASRAFSLTWAFYLLPQTFLKLGASGVLGAIVYLKLMEHYYPSRPE